MPCVPCSPDMFVFDIDVALSRRSECRQCKMDLSEWQRQHCPISLSRIHTADPLGTHTHSSEKQTTKQQQQQEERKKTWTTMETYVHCDVLWCSYPVCRTQWMCSFVSFHFIIALIIIFSSMYWIRVRERQPAKERQRKTTAFFHVIFSFFGSVNLYSSL